MYRTFLWVVIIILAMLIFYLSHQPATQSNQLSKGVTEFIAKITEVVVPNIEIDTTSFNHRVRKNAHFFIYLLLGGLVIGVLRKVGVRGYRSTGLALLICLVYAIFDEIHQLFVPGRGAQVKDVLIDGTGAAVGILIYLIVSSILRKEEDTR